MKILLLGATGMLGAVVLRRALAAGHQVTVLARDASKFGADVKSANIVVGDVRTADLSSLLDGQDAVIQSLGVGGKGDGRPTDICATGVKRVLAAMGTRPIRLIAVSNTGVQSSGGLIIRALPLFVRWLRPILEDKEQMEAALRASSAHWTAVRMPGLADRKPIGTPRFSGDGKDLGFTVSLENAADVLISLAGNEQYVRQAVSISD
ncbi:MAG: NAD(P)H-binding protein [Bryobacterales bacterium]|nr:NAD(P)H-binding protein [Bryobacterales bacterium]